MNFLSVFCVLFSLVISFIFIRIVLDLLFAVDVIYKNVYQVIELSGYMDLLASVAAFQNFSSTQGTQTKTKFADRITEIHNI